ncbi:MAG: glycosyltransferase, partial [Thermoguttaceae bacterium]|nr:glycosyltransferase [Thermoguttaceae bacterium]
RPRRVPSTSDIQAYLRLYRETLTFVRPDVVLTYGDCGLASSLLSEARLSGAKTVVYLHNLSYMNIRWFRNVDLAVVPSRFAAERYRATIGLESAILPPLIDPPRADVKPVSRDERKHILYVNPEPGKGARFFVAIASALWKIRRDIRFLVAEGRAGRSALLRVGKDDLKEVGSVDYVGNVVDFHALYRASRIALIPSLYEETFGRVAAEALSAGVPVVASDRGALPEVVGAGGVLIKIPKAYQPTNEPPFPDARDVAPWVRAIVRLWDDAAFYEEKQTNGRNQARRWEFPTVADAHEARLTALLERAR